MLPLLIDEGLPENVAAAFRQLELDAHAVGDEGAPPKQSEDGDNVAWCASRRAILVTNDRGKKDRVILRALEHQHVHAIFVYKDLRSGPPHHLARALLAAEARIDDLTARKKGHALLRHRLLPSGRLEPR